MLLILMPFSSSPGHSGPSQTSCRRASVCWRQGFCPLGETPREMRSLSPFLSVALTTMGNSFMSFYTYFSSNFVLWKCIEKWLTIHEIDRYLISINNPIFIVRVKRNLIQLKCFSMSIYIKSWWKAIPKSHTLTQRPLNERNTLMTLFKLFNVEFLLYIEKHFDIYPQKTK